MRDNIVIILLALTIAISGCQPAAKDAEGGAKVGSKEAPHEAKWGIYGLDLKSQKTELVYSSSEKIADISLNEQGDKFSFSLGPGAFLDTQEEIYTIGINGEELKQLTNNSTWEGRPVWSADEQDIAYLKWLNNNLDIYVMSADGTSQRKLYGSSGHDSDIHWQGDKIAFTRDSQIWLMDSDGSNAKQLTDPPRAGQTNRANLPFGDYDPRLSPDGTQIVFERLEDDTSVHGNYNIYLINTDGTGETKLTTNGYSQGLAHWSHDGKQIVYVVAAMGEVGKFDIYTMSTNGENNENVMPKYYPDEFLCHSAVFSADDSKIYFVGEWFAD